MSSAATLPEVINLVDESFSPEIAGSCHLSLSAEENSWSAAVLNTASNKYIALASNNRYPVSKKSILEAGFGSVSCSVAHPRFSLIPSALYDEENKASLLGFNHEVGKNEAVFSDSLPSLDAKNLYTTDNTLLSQVRSVFPAVIFRHSFTSFAEGLLRDNKNNKEKRVFVHFHLSFLEMVVLEGRELVFSNSFSFKTPEEVAYYILFVYEQLRLDPETVELVISGEIIKMMKEHSLLYTYIRNIRFAPLPGSFLYSYKFENIPSHTFFSLFNQYLVTH